MSAAKKTGWTLLLTVIAAAGLMSSAITLFPLLFLPLTFIYCNLRYGYAYGMLSAAAVFALPLAFGDAALSGALLAVYLPPVIAMSVGLKKKLSAYNALMLSISSYAVGILLLVLGFKLIGQTSISEYLRGTVSAFGAEQPDAARQLLVLLNAEGIVTGVTDMEAITALNDAAAAEQLTARSMEYFYTLLPELSVYFCFGGGTVTFLIARAWLKRRGAEVCAIPAFAKWRLPKNATWGMVFALLASFLYLIFPDVANIEIACSVMLCAVVFVAQVEGLSFTEFLLSRTRIKSRGVKNLILIAAASLLSFALTFAGLIDQAFHIKERMSVPKPPEKFY